MELAQVVPPEVLEYVRGLGTASGPLFAVLWWMEYRKNEKQRERADAVTERAITAMVETKATLQTFVTLLLPGGKR